MIKAVIFDIDNTLYSYDEAHAAAWEALCGYVREHLGLEREAFEAAHRESGRLQRQRLGADCAAVHNRMLRYQGILEPRGLGLSHVLPMNNLYWDTLIRHARPEPGIIACLQALKQAGYLLGIGTDMTVDYQLKKLTGLQMLPYFDFLVSSEEVNVEKPHEKLFLTCAGKAGVAPEECLFIGDNYQKDIVGARNAGMSALWYCPRGREGEGILTHYDLLAEQMAAGQKERES